MSLRLKEIAEGWRNNLFPPEKQAELIATVSKERNIICMNCPNHSRFHITFRPDDHCTNCGCTLAAKTKCLSCKCPLDPPLWDAIETS